jgi:hypothetical protein
MSKTIYERILHNYNEINSLSINPYYYIMFNNYNLKKFDIIKLNTLKIILDLINDINNNDIQNLFFNKYIKNIKFKKQYFKINGDKFDTFENILDFLDKLENVKTNGDINNDLLYNEINMYDELYTILLKI